MKNLAFTHPLVRALGVFGIVAALVTSVTFAALQSQATLTNNTITSATAGLEVKSSGSFAAQDAGFVFSGALPGGPAVPATGHAFQLRNSGTANLVVAASIPTMPTFTVGSSGVADPAMIDVILSCIAGANSFSVTASVADLVAAHATGGVVMPSDILPAGSGNVADCTAQVQLNSGAFTGSSLTTGNFNLVFTGVASLPGL